MTPNKTTQPPVISRQRLDHILKIVFTDVLEIAVDEEEYMLAHLM